MRILSESVARFTATSERWWGTTGKRCFGHICVGKALHLKMRSQALRDNFSLWNRGTMFCSFSCKSLGYCKKHNHLDKSSVAVWSATRWIYFVKYVVQILRQHAMAVLFHQSSSNLKCQSRKIWNASNQTTRWHCSFLTCSFSPKRYIFWMLVTQTCWSKQHNSIRHIFFWGKLFNDLTLEASVHRC